MRTQRRRRSAPKVRNGKVQKKNRWQRTPNCYNVIQPEPVIDRRRPGEGYRHVVSKRDMQRFIPLIPDWSQIARGLDVVVIDNGGNGCMGWFRPTFVAICAWERELIWENCCDEFLKDHREIFDKLGVPYRLTGGEDAVEQYEFNREWGKSNEDFVWTVEWTENTARAFLLAHVLIHELGHHHDCVTTKSKRDSCRGETYAERYARVREDVIIERYFNEFGY